MSKNQIMSFKVDDEWKSKLEELARQLGKSKSALIRKCVVIGAKVLIAEMKEKEAGIPTTNPVGIPISPDANL